MLNQAGRRRDGALTFDLSFSSLKMAAMTPSSSICRTSSRDGHTSWRNTSFPCDVTPAPSSHVRGTQFTHSVSLDHFEADSEQLLHNNSASSPYLVCVCVCAARPTQWLCVEVDGYSSSQSEGHHQRRRRQVVGSHAFAHSAFTVSVPRQDAAGHQLPLVDETGSGSGSWREGRAAAGSWSHLLDGTDHRLWQWRRVSHTGGTAVANHLEAAGWDGGGRA